MQEVLCRQEHCFYFLICTVLVEKAIMTEDEGQQREVQLEAVQTTTLLPLPKGEIVLNMYLLNLHY